MTGMGPVAAEQIARVVATLMGCMVISYLIGNISPAILIGRAMGVDIKKQGSGNAGTTNALRVLGKKAAAATLLIDVAKGVLAVLLGWFFGGQHLAMLCGFAVICGHIWPVAFGLKGGKGVATAFGVIVAVQPLWGLIELCVVLLVVLITRRVSAGSLTGACLFPFLALLLGAGEAGRVFAVSWAAALAVIIVVKHRANLTRLLKGQEPKLNFKKQENEG